MVEERKPEFIDKNCNPNKNTQRIWRICRRFEFFNPHVWLWCKFNIHSSWAWQLKASQGVFSHGALSGWARICR